MEELAQNPELQCNHYRNSWLKFFLKNMNEKKKSQKINSSAYKLQDRELRMNSKWKLKKKPPAKHLIISFF